MSTTSFLAKLGAVAASVAAPAMLFLGAGTAAAAGNALDVWGTSGPGGVNVFVTTPADGLSGWCTYSSFVRGNPIGKPLPAIDVPFYLGSVGGMNSALLWFPSYPTGSTWDTTVSCPNGAMTVPTVW